MVDSKIGVIEAIAAGCCVAVGLDVKTGLGVAVGLGVTVATLAVPMPAVLIDINKVLLAKKTQ